MWDGDVGAAPAAALEDQCDLMLADGMGGRFVMTPSQELSW